MSSYLYIGTSVNLYGVNLDLNGVTKYFEILPTETHLLGELKSPGKQNSAKYKKSVWVFTTEGYFEDLNSAALDFFSKFSSKKICSPDFYGMDEGCLDFFIAQKVNHGELGNEIALYVTNEVSHLISSMGLPVKFSACNIVR